MANRTTSSSSSLVAAAAGSGTTTTTTQGTMLDDGGDGISSSTHKNPREIFETSGDPYKALQVVEHQHLQHYYKTGHSMTLQEQYNRVWLSSLIASSSSNNNNNNNNQKVEEDEEESDELPGIVTYGPTYRRLLPSSSSNKDDYDEEKDKDKGVVDNDGDNNNNSTSSLKPKPFSFLRRVQLAQESILDLQEKTTTTASSSASTTTSNKKDFDAATKSKNNNKVQRENFILTYNQALMSISSYTGFCGLSNHQGQGIMMTGNWKVDYKNIINNYDHLELFITESSIKSIEEELKLCTMMMYHDDDVLSLSQSQSQQPTPSPPPDSVENVKLSVWLAFAYFEVTLTKFPYYQITMSASSSTSTPTTTTTTRNKSSTSNNNNNEEEEKDDDDEYGGEKVDIIDESNAAGSKGHPFTDAPPPQVDWEFLQAVKKYVQDALDKLTKLELESSSSSSSSTNGNDNDDNSNSDLPQLKFLWSLYKSRLDFFERDEDTGKCVDDRIRSARKELKTAMEIFQHKLLLKSNGSANDESTAGGGSYRTTGTESLTNATGTAANNTGSNNTGNSNSNTNHGYVQPAMSKDLQAMNRAALNLKANTELLKGNIKKSLILCSEALLASSCGVDDDDDAGDNDESKNSNSNSNSNNNNNNNIQSQKSKKRTKAYYDAIHHNNLGLVYEASGKSYLALHSLSKAITSIEKASIMNDGNGDDGNKNENENENDKKKKNKKKSTAPCNFDTDGTVRSDVTVPILNNAAICSLRTGNYVAAYECMSKCVIYSEVWSKGRTNTWVHLAEACIGMYTQLKKKQKADSVPTYSAAASSSVSMGGKPRGLVVGTSSSKATTQRNEGGEEMVWTDFTERDLPKLGTTADVEFTKKFPIVRAKFCLQTALKYFERMKTMSPRDVVAHQSARCSMAYVCMEMKEYATAQRFCEKLILAGYDLINSHNPTTSDDTGDAAGGDKKDSKNVKSKLDDAQLTLIKRLMATARLYASEACSILGDSMSSMTFILGDKKENALDRLAMDLSGVTIEKANSSPKAKTQLAKAQCMVRCNASAAWSVIGNHPVARQLAMSAQAMENSYSTTRDDSAARKALIYGMLREGNQGAALLTLLRSSPSSSIR